MKKIIFLFTLAIAGLTNTLSAQNEKSNVLVWGTVQEFCDETNLENTVITLLQDEEEIQKHITKRSGKFEFTLEYNHNYKLVFSADNYVTKSVEIDTRNVPGNEQEGGAGFDLDMKLFKNFDGIDYTLFTKPIGLAKYDAKNRGITFSKKYSDTIKEDIERLTNKTSEKYGGCN
jgi:hypothetical protein